MRKKVFYVREYFTERGPYDVVFISKSDRVHFLKSDGELYCREKCEGRLETRK